MVVRNNIFVQIDEYVFELSHVSSSESKAIHSLVRTFQKAPSEQLGIKLGLALIKKSLRSVEYGESKELWTPDQEYSSNEAFSLMGISPLTLGKLSQVMMQNLEATPPMFLDPFGQPLDKVRILHRNKN